MTYGFTKQDRSSFKYWFAHWCAFQMVALNCHSWCFRYLFHDWYKPWMKLFCKYETVQMFHNKHSNHHLLHWFYYLIPEYKMDWKAMIIDWECSRFTKQASPLTAEDELNRIISTLMSWDLSNKTVRQLRELNNCYDLDYNNPTTQQDIDFKHKVNIVQYKLTQALIQLGLDKK